MVFVFLFLTSLSKIISDYIHFAANGIILFFSLWLSGTWAFWCLWGIRGEVSVTCERIGLGSRVGWTGHRRMLTNITRRLRIYCFVEIAYIQNECIILLGNPHLAKWFYKHLCIPVKNHFMFIFTPLNSVRLYFSGLQNHYRWWLQPWN